MKLYHRTTPEAVALILKTGEFVAKEADGSVYLSNRLNGMTTGYGDAWVVLNVPATLCTLDDEYPGGERHYRVNRRDLRREHIVRAGPAQSRAGNN